MRVNAAFFFKGPMPMRHVLGALAMAALVAVIPQARAQEPALQLGLGGFHDGFLLARDPGHAFTARVRGQDFYRTSLGDLQISASVGGGPQEVVPGETGRERRLLSAGLQLGYGGFLGGLAYGFNERGQRYEQQHSLAAGLRYATKRLSFGPAFAVSWGEDGETRPQNVYILEFGASYSLAPGIDAVGSLQHSRAQQPRTGGGRDDQGTAGLFGISLSF